MICGISGSGKTALSKEMELFGVPRLSIDEELWPDFYVLSDIISDEHKDYLYSEAMKRIRQEPLIFAPKDAPAAWICPFAKRNSVRTFVLISKTAAENLFLYG